MKLHIGNLSKTTTENELTALIAPIASPTSVEIVKDMAGISKGFGFAEFSTDDEAKAVITGLNGKDFGGNELRLGEARPRKGDARSKQPQNPQV